MASTRLVHQVIIREGHLDSFGHVNNATYLQLFEEARWEFITERGYGYDRVHELRIGPTILEVQLTFKREIRLRQKIRIESETTEYKGKIGVLVQEMKDESDQVCCRAVFKFGLFDMNRRKLIEPTSEWLTAIGFS